MKESASERGRDGVIGGYGGRIIFSTCTACVCVLVSVCVVAPCAVLTAAAPQIS